MSHFWAAAAGAGIAVGIVGSALTSGPGAGAGATGIGAIGSGYWVCGNTLAGMTPAGVVIAWVMFSAGFIATATAAAKLPLGCCWNTAASGAWPGAGFGVTITAARTGCPIGLPGVPRVVEAGIILLELAAGPGFDATGLGFATTIATLSLSLFGRENGMMFDFSSGSGVERGDRFEAAGFFSGIGEVTMAGGAEWGDGLDALYRRANGIGLRSVTSPGSVGPLGRRLFDITMRAVVQVPSHHEKPACWRIEGVLKRGSWEVVPPPGDRDPHVFVPIRFPSS